jgi:hypothetical protein
MNVEPKVTLKLGAACPRKQECASNHRVGWLQDVTRWEKSFRFRRRLVQLRTPVGPPIRDAESGAPFPFYSESSTFDFKDDADFYRVNHSDSPAFGALWEDSKDPHPSSSPLEQVIFKLGFTAWLVVQNIEWSSRDVPGSLVYLGNFDWSLDCTLNVTTAPPARRTTEPQVFTPQITASGKGKGSRTPSFTPESANESVKTDVTDLSVPAGDRKAPRPSPHR